MEEEARLITRAGGNGAGAEDLTGTGVGGARAALSGGEAARLLTGAEEGKCILT